MKDILGKEVKPGDILLEVGRGGYGTKLYFMRLWEMPENYIGHGYEYHITEEKSLFAWTYLDKCFKLDLNILPEEFKFSFYHGMSDISTIIDPGEIPINEEAAMELINNSDWKENTISIKDVDRFKKMQSIKITSFQDIKNNIKELTKPGYIPAELIYDVLKVAKINKTNPDFGNYKGEIGIASVYDQLYYEAVINKIAENPNALELFNFE